MQEEIPKHNNLDLIRLLAALQVAIVHGVEHLGMRLPFHEITHAILICFPGVPIFFIISGFLISASWQRSSNHRDFFRNRILRLFPALWFCFVFTVLLVSTTGYFSAHPFTIASFVIWAGTQLTFVQFFNPEFLREFGVGAVNGSLWTIPVEMQFYVLTPILVWIVAQSRVLFWGLFAGFVILNTIHNWLPSNTGYQGIYKSLAAVSFLPWVYMFMLGVMLNRYWSAVAPFLVGKFHYWLVAYGLTIVLQLILGVGANNNGILFPWVIVIAGLTMSGAVTKPQLAHGLLGNNDISYGLYIYHMPIYNFVLEKDWGLGTQMTWLALIASIMIAAFSWNLIEKPALQLKKYSIRRVSLRL
jgi:peptidoglycan/LPS O-acetylase OafA/YrhL